MATVPVYETLRREIISGERKPGSTLVETELAAHFGVSRTPVREALFKLGQDGLVERSGRSVAVRSQSPEAIMETYEVRLMLEGLAARMAAQRRTDLDLVRIKSAHRALVSANSNDPVATREALTVLRAGIWASSHNSMLLNVLNYVYAHVPHFVESTLQSPGRWATILREYEEIIRAIEEQLPDDAQAMTEAQLNSMIQARLDFLATHSS